jgi:hypothetical protein
MTSEQSGATVKNEYNIKNVKSFMGMDCPGYNLSLYKGSTKIADVINDGSGGCVDFRYVNKEVQTQFENMLKAFPKYYDSFYEKEVTMDDETFVCILLDEYETNKKFKRECKKKTLYRLKTDTPDQYWTMKMEFSQKVKDHLIKKHADNLLEIINEKYN